MIAPRTGAAQQWLSDRARAEGRGIHLGDFELHPGIGAELGWTNNVYLADTDKLSGAILRVVPHLFLSTQGAGGGVAPDTPVGFRAGVSGVLRKFFATSGGMGIDPPKLDIGVGQDARLFLRPSKIFRAEFYDEYRRTIDPFVEATRPIPSGTTAPNGGIYGTRDYNRDMLGVGTRLQLASRGELFRVGAGYRLDLDHFESGVFAAERNRSHTISADTSWEFLPQTALVWNGAVRIRQYANPVASTSNDLHSDSVDASSLIGLNGAFTSRISATAAVGYAAGFFDRGQDPETVIVQVEGRWKIRETMQWSVGYDRQLGPTFMGNFAIANRIKTRLQAMFGGALLIALKGDVTFVSFGDDPGDMGQGNRKDTYLNLNLNGEYRFVDWLALTGEVGYIQDFSDYVINSGSTDMNAVRDPVKFQQIIALIGIRAFL